MVESVLVVGGVVVLFDGVGNGDVVVGKRVVVVGDRVVEVSDGDVVVGGRGCGG